MPLSSSPSAQRASQAKRRFMLSLVLLIFVLFLLFYLNIRCGSQSYSASEIYAALQHDPASPALDIIWKIRLPRTVAVFILGGALGLSGFLMQTFFRNPIAGPYILGISSGSRLAVSIIMIIVIGKWEQSPSSFTLILAAFVGAFLSMLLVLLISRVVENSAVLIVAGVMISYISSALTDVLITFATDNSLLNLQQWSRGSFSGMSWEHVQAMALPVLGAALATFMLSKPLAAFRLGESYAQSLGVNVKLFRLLLVSLSSLLAAAVTAFAGPVSFVGIAVPHLVKNLVDSSRPVEVVPLCFIGGSAFSLLCDLLSRTLVAPLELALSSVTAVLGAPIVLFVLLQKSQNKAQD